MFHQKLQRNEEKLNKSHWRLKYRCGAYMNSKKIADPYAKRTNKKEPKLTKIQVYTILHGDAPYNQHNKQIEKLQK